MPSSTAMARQDARDIAVEDGMFFTEGNAQNRSCSVVSDAGQCESIIQPRWKFSAVLRDNFLCSLLQIARTAVIPEAGPEAQHLFLRRSSKRANVREALQKSFVVRNRGRNASLL